jgi:hypothetical protein
MRFLIRMTALAAHPQTRQDGGARLRAVYADAVWPVRKAAWKLEEKLVWRGTDAARGRFDSARWPFERAGWALERRLVWPLQDFLAARGIAARAALSLMLVAAAAAAVAVGVLIAQGSGTDSGGVPDSSPAVLAVSPALPATGARPEQGPTLEGATPNFESSPAEAESPAAAGPAGAPDATAATRASGGARPSAIASAPGGETHALRAARKFADAFVLYEVGERGAEVRKRFAATATPALAKALRQRPPRLPGEVDVPKARVANVVLGERQRKQIEASVSLLRLGNLSELRLTLTKDRKQGWAVSEVRG